jgi:hypothetical protein
MSDQPSTPQEGQGQKSSQLTFRHPWASKPGYWGPPEPWRAPTYGPYGPVVGAPPMAPPPNFNYFYQGNQAQITNQGNQSSHSSSKSSVQPDPKKRKVAENALATQPKTALASGSSQPVQVGKPVSSTQTLQSAKRVESFARLNRKAQLYQAAMDRFRRSLVYHNRRFHENIKEADLVDLVDKSVEMEMTVAQKKKQKNRDRLRKRKAKSLADKASKPKM